MMDNVYFNTYVGFLTYLFYFLAAVVISPAFVCFELRDMKHSLFITSVIFLLEIRQKTEKKEKEQKQGEKKKVESYYNVKSQFFAHIC